MNTTLLSTSQYQLDRQSEILDAEIHTHFLEADYTINIGGVSACMAYVNYQLQPSGSGKVSPLLHSTYHAH